MMEYKLSLMTILYPSGRSIVEDLTGSSRDSYKKVSLSVWLYVERKNPRHPKHNNVVLKKKSLIFKPVNLKIYKKAI